MLVQTLVDNAIKHGIAELADGGTIRIDAGMVGSDLRLVVTDTGAFRPAHDGYGLRNATDRLRLLYGTGASLTVRDVEGHTEPP
jgi:LytS/YehU family sensor histidine kinase